MEVRSGRSAIFGPTISGNSRFERAKSRFSVNQLSNGIYLCVFQMPHIGQKTAKLIVEH